MEMVIVVIISIALIVCGGMTMSQGFMSSADRAALSVEAITVSRGDAMRTGISLLGVEKNVDGNIEVTLSNTGQMKLASFSKWDVIVQYYDSGSTYHVAWLPYTDEALGDNEWQKTGIYLDAGAETAEAFEPNILNPGEEMAIEAKLNPPPQGGTTVDVIIATPNGVEESGSFTY